MVEPLNARGARPRSCGRAQAVEADRADAQRWSCSTAVYPIGVGRRPRPTVARPALGGTLEGAPASPGGPIGGRALSAQRTVRRRRGSWARDGGWVMLHGSVLRGADGSAAQVSVLVEAAQPAHLETVADAGARPHTAGARRHQAGASRPLDRARRLPSSPSRKGPCSSTSSRCSRRPGCTAVESSSARCSRRTAPRGSATTTSEPTPTVRCATARCLGVRTRRAARPRGPRWMAATSARNREPFSPSTCRWSKDSASVVTWRTDDLVPSTDPRLLAHRAEAQDRGLARVDDRRAGVDAEDADVGDRERAAAHLGRLGLALAGGRGELVERRRRGRAARGPGRP